MTAAANHSSDRTGCQQQWRRTVFVRQGRFFVISVTVRSKCDLPLRTAFSRTYTAGRFTVKEEIQWLSKVASQKAEDRSSAPIHVVYRSRHFCSRWECADTVLGRAPSQGQKQQSNGHSADAQTTQTQQHQLEQQQQHQQAQAHSLQTAAPAHVTKVASSWWKRLLCPRSASRSRATTPKPSAAAAGSRLDERVSVGCLRLGSSWGSSLRRTLSKMARTLKCAAGLKPAALGAGPHLTVRGGLPDATSAAVSTAAVASDASAASGTGVCTKTGLAGVKPGAVLVTVLGYYPQ